MQTYNFWVYFDDGSNIELFNVLGWKEAKILAQAERIIRGRSYNNWTHITQEMDYGWETVKINDD
jgi:hypothetical protein